MVTLRKNIGQEGLQPQHWAVVINCPP